MKYWQVKVKETCVLKGLKKLSVGKEWSKWMSHNFEHQWNYL